MKTLSAIVGNGTITLPPDAAVPDGSRVQIVWDESAMPPLERDAWTENELHADLAWAQTQDKRA